MPPVLQVALDFVDMSRAMKVAREAVLGGADWLEAGTPLIKSEGLNAVRELRKEFPRHTLVADMKTMDAGRIEMETAAKAGANIAVVLAVATDATIEECVRAGRNFGVAVAADLLGVEDVVGRARQLAKLGVSHVGVHLAIDEQMKGKDPFQMLRAVAKAVKCPVAVAGGINAETAADAVRAGAEIIIVGGAVTKSPDAKKATAEIRRAIRKRIKIKTDLYKRVSAEGVREVFLRTATADISHANHNMPGLSGIAPIVPGVKMVGRAVTVRTYPGDWAKSVEAIDAAKEGEVVVVDSGGVGPAVWGEMATNSAVQKKLAGVVIDGAIRDTAEIRRLRFPAFAKCVVPHAGEPKGFGEIGVPVVISGVRVNPGDWIIGDDDGVVVVPQGEAAEMANRAMDCLEAEQRILREIRTGRTTLGKVIELIKWEKR